MRYCTCHRRNPDDALRDAERRARVTGDPNDLARWVSERLRAGEIDSEDFQATVGAGHPIASIVAGENKETRVTERLIHASDSDTVRIALINTLTRLLDSPRFSEVTSQHPADRLADGDTIAYLRLVTDATVRDLSRLPYHEHIVAQILQILPRVHKQSEFNLLTYALHLLWDWSPLRAIDSGTSDTLNDVFEFLGHAHPEGRIATVLELGNTLLGIPGGLP